MTDDDTYRELGTQLTDIYLEALTAAGSVEALKRLTLPYESAVTAFMVVDELPFDAAVEKLKRQVGSVDRETAIHLVLGALDALERSHQPH